MHVISFYKIFIVVFFCRFFVLLHFYCCFLCRFASRKRENQQTKLKNILPPSIAYKFPFSFFATQFSHFLGWIYMTAEKEVGNKISNLIS